MKITNATGMDKMPAVKADNCRGERFLVESKAV
jgi:hypothetical protein